MASWCFFNQLLTYDNNNSHRHHHNYYIKVISKTKQDIWGENSLSRLRSQQTQPIHGHEPGIEPGLYKWLSPLPPTLLP